MRASARAGFVSGILLGGFFASEALAAGPYRFYSITPCRIVDTRGTVGPTGGPALSGQATRSFPIRGQCGIPSGAQAVVLNVTIVSPTDSGGYLTLFPYNTTLPIVSTINWMTGEPALANGAIVPLSPDLNLQLSVYCSMPLLSSTVHLLLDVTGYFS